MKGPAKLPGGASLMIVEDDRAASEILGFIVTSRFPENAVYFAYDGSQGVETFKEHLPDIVVTDINMPRMDGIQMAEQIKKIRPGTKIIVLTAYSDRIHLEKFAQLGISRHLLKPLQFDLLISAIAEAGAELRGAQK